MLENYLPILVFIAIGLGLGAFLELAGYFAAPRKEVEDKLLPFECGFDAFEDARHKFDVRFYLVAILFIIFDLEVAFLFPWAVVFQELDWFAIGAMGVFLGLLVVGFIYEWKKGALEWE
ncbi:NADH-quinone oxidoreductase subunit A [Aliikangiella maris]|uniref:NADH-quinone oxidoreductase subunit A n=2 Tax=Aliikangiella maris TaxID=3162458 RepID=A0ABV2BRG5_9GAMM